MPSISSIKRTASRIKKAEHLPHHAALDLASQRAGYSNWKHVLSSADSAGSDLLRILDRYPTLSSYGLGKGDLSVEELRMRRRDLLGNEGSFRAVCMWLRRLPAAEDIERSRTSYALKHIVEREIGYISNGVFIAAVLHADFRILKVDDSPNVYLNIDKQVWDRETQRIDASCQRILNDHWPMPPSPENPPLVTQTDGLK